VTILGLDTATAACTVCVLRADGEAFERSPGPERLLARPAHSGELMPAVAAAMAEARVDWGDLEAIAVGVGPGAFTGLRIGVATARALAQANGLPVRAVSSLAALAEGIDDRLSLPLIDARRGELFGALYEDGVPVWEPFVATPEDVAERVRATGAAPLAAGDGSLRFRQVVEGAGARVAADGSQAHVVRALHVCRLAVALPDTPPETVVPHYLRAPDATPNR
jgi:tRNA threonylcarbamoyladenosine biosynthesis protein TsaB